MAIFIFHLLALNVSTFQKAKLHNFASMFNHMSEPKLLDHSSLILKQK